VRTQESPVVAIQALVEAVNGSHLDVLLPLLHIPRPFARRLRASRWSRRVDDAARGKCRERGRDGRHEFV